jgi:hypothetical protein
MDGGCLHIDWRLAQGTQGHVVAVVARRNGGFQFELGGTVIEGRAEVHARAHVRIQRALRRVKGARFLRSAADPSKPVDVAIVGPDPSVGESLAVVVIPIHFRGLAELAQIVDTLGGFGGFLAPAQNGQQQSGQDGYDGDDDQQLHQSEPLLLPLARLFQAFGAETIGLRFDVVEHGIFRAPAACGEAAFKPLPAARANFLFRFAHVHCGLAADPVILALLARTR